MRRGRGETLPFVLPASAGKEYLIKRRAALFIVLGVVAVLLAACARTPVQRAAGIVARISDDLKLNDVQKDRLNKIKDEFLARRPEMIKSREAGFEEAVALMKSDTIDPAKLSALRDKALSGTDDTIRFLFAKFTEFHDMLTPEQRAKAAELMMKYHEAHKQ